MVADLVYLDYNCFQRGFDDHSQTRVRMEALACEDIFYRAERGQITLVWSFIHADETEACPQGARREAVVGLARICREVIDLNPRIIGLANSISERSSVAPKDALHLAAAFDAGAEYFLTCDDQLARQVKRLNLEIHIMNPVDYVSGRWQP